MDIEALLNKYFEGETSCEEERHLREFFASEDVPEYLSAYRPLFSYFTQEIEKRQQEERQVEFRLPSIPAGQFSRKVLIRSLAGIAATVLLLVGLYTFRGMQQDCLCAGNYVIINGRCYTNPDKVREYALQALQQVSSSPDEWMIDLSSDYENNKIVENELNRLGEMFDDSDFKNITP